MSTWNSNQQKKKSKYHQKYNDNNDMMNSMNMFNSFGKLMMNQASQFNDLEKRYQNNDDDFDAFGNDNDDFGNTYSSDDSDERALKKLQKEVKKYKKIVKEKNNEIQKLKINESNIHKQNTIIQSLRDENNTLKSKLNNDNQRIKQQDDQIRVLQAECYRLKLINSKPTKNEIDNNLIVLKLQQQVKTLKGRIEEQQTQDSNATYQLTLQQSKIEMLENKLVNLEHEKKEMEMENMKLKKENKMLKLQNIDTNNYKEWGVNEIVNWIISIDPQIYGKYENMLKKSLTEEEFNGEYLDSMEESDIKLWGIKNFKHRKILMQNVKKLIANDNKDKIGVNEGAIAPTTYI